MLNLDIVLGEYTEEQRMMIIQTFHHFSTWRVVSSGRSGGQQRYKFITLSNSIEGVMNYKKRSPPRWWVGPCKKLFIKVIHLWRNTFFYFRPNSIFSYFLFLTEAHLWEKKKSTLYLSVIGSLNLSDSMMLLVKINIRVHNQRQVHQLIRRKLVWLLEQLKWSTYASTSNFVMGKAHGAYDEDRKIIWQVWQFLQLPKTNKL